MCKLKKGTMKNNVQPFLLQKKKNCRLPLCLSKLRDKSDTIVHVYYCVAKGIQGFLESKLAHLKLYLLIYLAIQQIFCKDIFL